MSHAVPRSRRKPEPPAAPPEPAEPDPVEQIAAAIEDEAQKRLWARTLLEILKVSPAEDASDVENRAWEWLHITCCRRLVQLLGPDLPAAPDPHR